MKFKPGKYYQHKEGNMLHCIQFVDTTLYGKNGLLAEDDHGDIHIVGQEDSNAKNWREIDKLLWFDRWCIDPLTGKQYELEENK